MREPPLLDQERRARELIASLKAGVLGARVRRERLAQGVSIRELAAAANLGPDSIVRLESGSEFRPMTLLKVCAALKVHLDRLGEVDESEVVALHRKSDDRWHDLEDYGGDYLGGSDGVLEKEARWRIVSSTGQNPILLLKSRLSAGKLLPTLIELHRQSEPRSHSGEEFVFVLEGPVNVTVAGREYTLQTGESMDFWGTEVHSYSPAGDSPGLILSVRIKS